MEALEGPGRKSGLLDLINRDQDRTATSRPYASTMAVTATSPTSLSMFSNGPPPPPYSESRRTSDNKAELPPPLQMPRQSLPSIHEALQNGAPKSNPYTSPSSASLLPSHSQPPYQPPPSIPRTYPSEHASYPPQLAPHQPRRPSPPQPAQSAQRFRTGAPTSYPESRSVNPGPPPNPYPPSRYNSSSYETDPRVAESMSGYAHHPPPAQQSSYQYGPPPGHLPPTGPPGPYNHPRYDPRDGRERDWKPSQSYKNPLEFSHGLKRHLDVWDFENNLAQINTSSQVLMEWAHHYNSIAQEQQRGTNVIPDRMPALESCKEMIEHGDAVVFCLARMKDMIQQQENHVVDQRMREQGGKGGDYDDDVRIYDNKDYNPDGKKQRRGRAAPPGRCHSCNRAETPEWRRGPDGARTLCNACGLHYAKLNRKEQMMKQTQGSNGSSLRPKSMDDNAPRTN